MFDDLNSSKVGHTAEKVIGHELRPFCTLCSIALVSTEEKRTQILAGKWNTKKERKKKERKKKEERIQPYSIHTASASTSYADTTR